MALKVVIVEDNYDLVLKPGPDGRCTSNSDPAVGMIGVLKDAGWKTRRVLPFDDVAWIIDDWFPAVRRAIVGPIRPRGPETGYRG